jgi:hypothetical protein
MLFRLTFVSFVRVSIFNRLGSNRSFATLRLVVCKKTTLSTFCVRRVISVVTSKINVDSFLAF